MPTITPGHDFGVNEVPAFDKMLVAAAGLHVTGLTLDDLPNNLTGLLTGTESGTSGASLPDEGWLWHTPSGETFIEQRWYLDDLDSDSSGVTEERIAVPLFRNDGGWYSARFRHNANGDELGAPVTTSRHYSNDERYVTWRKSLPNFEADGGRLVGLTWDTGTSGSRGIIVGRGPASIRDLGYGGENDGTERRFYHNTVLTWAFADWMTDNPTQGADRSIGHNIGRSRARGSSVVGSMAGVWLFSHVMYGAL